MLRTLPFLLLLPLVGTSVSAQDRCNAHTLTQRFLNEQGLSTDIAQALAKLPAGHVKAGGSLTVPVAVHVVWNTASENVPDATIIDMIATMNEDYQGLNPDFGSVRATFTGAQGVPNITFCLAQFDPNGNATTGITRTQTSDNWFDPDLETNDMKSAPSGIDPWDPESYLNIWICDIASGLGGGLITTGYAYLPVGGMVGSSIDGIVIDYNYGLDAGARTATHEAGHYLGLQHPWGSNGGCVDDDGFSDTPDTEGPTFSCTPTNQTSCGVLTQYENFMDYSSCSCMFTDQQGAEMTDVLTGVRSGLLSSSGCSSTTTGPCIPASLTGTDDGDFIDGVVLGTINNTASGSTGGASYTNYSSSESTVVQPGTTYTISITGGDYQPDHYAAWIDYDQDDTYEASEKLGEFTTTAIFQTQTLSFTVPMGATLGTTTMRVRGVYHGTGEPSPTEPCYAYQYGETEDYGITVTSTGVGACIPTSTNGTADGDFIDGVVLGTIVNTNSGSTAGPTYNDYTSENTDLARSQSYTIAITGGDYQPDHYAAWIDYDQDDTYEAGEKLGEFITNQIGQTQTLTFTVPGAATLGSTHMRVRGVFHNTGEPSPTDPCFAYAWGETEDYGVNIEVSTGLGSVNSSSGLLVTLRDDRIQVRLPSAEVGVLQVLDASGRLVFNMPTRSDVVLLDMEPFAAGMLQLVWTTPSNRMTGRFVITE
ncbi:MAG: hypothetical protein IPN38_00630 [Flavobacteriales bacterium]|nr:hypothetical protein [Flavobacteriales bacterium]